MFAPYPGLSPDSGERGLVRLVSKRQPTKGNRRKACWSPLSLIEGGEWGWGLEKQTAVQWTGKEAIKGTTQAAKASSARTPTARRPSP